MPMRVLILTALLLAYATHTLAASANLTITYSPDPSWQVAGDKTYLNLPVDTVTAPRRLAIIFFADGVQAASVWDQPSSRKYNISVPMVGTSTSSHITAQAVAYEDGPWRASTVYSLGDKISIGEYPSPYYWMEVTRAGTSGVTEPTWPTKHAFTLARENTLAAAAITDLGNGNVGIPVTGHNYWQGEQITLSGTINYDGTYTLSDQASGTADVLVIAHAYTAETLTGAETAAVANSAVIDNGNGTVDIPCPEHGMVLGQDVTIAGTINYDGTYTLGDQTSADSLTVTATYTAEAITGGYAIDTTIDDPDSGGVGWTFTDADGTPLVVLTSDKSRRQIGKVVEGSFHQGGLNFRVRNAQ